MRLPYLYAAAFAGSARLISIYIGFFVPITSSMSYVYAAVAETKKHVMKRSPRRNTFRRMLLKFGDVAKNDL